MQLATGDIVAEAERIVAEALAAERRIECDLRCKISIRAAVGGRLFDEWNAPAWAYERLWAAKIIFNPPWASMVFAVFAHNADDTDALRHSLYDSYRKTYQRTIAASIREVGCKPGRVEVTDGPVLQELWDEAGKWSRSISNTYNTRLSAAIGQAIEGYRTGHAGSLRGINRNFLAKAIRPWITNYWRGRRGANRADGSRTWISGKTKQISITEQTRAYVMARLTFAAKSNLGPQEARVVPGQAVCDECRALVQLGWVPLQEARGFLLPVHPSCPHVLETRRVKPKTPVDCGQLWRGG